MNNCQRFECALRGEMPDDRLPVIEWATWWNLTLERWREEGLDASLSGDALFRALQLDAHRQFWLPSKAESCPRPRANGAALMENDADYDALRTHLYPKARTLALLDRLREAENARRAGDTVLWYTLDGAFWFPRTLFGIEGHLFSFYDESALYHRILDDLAEYQIWQLDQLYGACAPQFMTIAEDMSYNLGPMLSEAFFDEFLLPYYRKIVPAIRDRGTKVFIDSDGDVTRMIPWLRRAGIQGILPLERMSGVDVNAIKAAYPDFLLIGGFDKTRMKFGADVMRGEFARLLPAMRAGGYIPGVDHQTPPDVSLNTYREYVSLLHEYAQNAVRN